MIRILMILAICQLHITLLAQQNNWFHSFGGSGNTERASNITSNANKILICGVSNSTNGTFENSQGEDVWVLVLDTSGLVLDTLRFGGTLNEGGKEIIPTNDGGYALIGISFSTNGDAYGANYHGNGDVWVVKLDSSFNIEWQQMYGGSNRDDPQAIIETSDGNLLIASFTASSNGDVTGFHSGSPIWNDAWILKINLQGTIIWQKCIGGSADEAAWSIVETPTAYILAGHSQSSDGDILTNYGNRDLMVTSLSKTTGNINWLRTLGGSDMDTGLDLIYTSRNTIAVAGHANSNDSDIVNLNGMSEFWYIDMDTLGNLITSHTYGSPGADVAYAIEEINTNEYVLIGRAGTAGTAGGNVSNIYGGTDAWVMAVDSNGTFLYEQNFGGSSSDIFYGSYLSQQGTLFAAGQTTSSDYNLTQNMGGNDWFIARISLMSMVNISNPESQFETDFISIFPNPSSGNINILTDNEAIQSIELLDIYGRVLHKLKPGTNNLQLPNGTYLIRLFYNNKDNPDIQKIIIKN